MSVVRVTPLLGGKTDGAVCCLLEIGGSRILLDCGGSIDLDFNSLLSIASDLVVGGGIDAVVISHADMDHMGSLPTVFGRLGLGGVPVICTTPVSKFGKMILYDHCLNRKMEGSSSSAEGGQDQFDLDDIDLALSNVTTVKYSQTIHLPGISESAGSRRHVTLCAYPSGRTIGGSIWRIRHGATEVMYVMDINLRKEVVLDGVRLNLLPTVPDLLIVEGGSVNRGFGMRRGGDASGLIQSVIDTMRENGNVLIPCESAGRALELMQILGKHWLDNKLGMYHLVFMSHMSFNILEYAQVRSFLYLCLFWLVSILHMEDSFWFVLCNSIF
jgi:cleavage and polyadenylation specificity factor subunit 2